MPTAPVTLTAEQVLEAARARGVPAFAGAVGDPAGTCRLAASSTASRSVIIAPSTPGMLRARVLPSARSRVSESIALIGGSEGRPPGSPLPLRRPTHCEGARRARPRVHSGCGHGGVEIEAGDRHAPERGLVAGDGRPELGDAPADGLEREDLMSELVCARRLRVGGKTGSREMAAERLGEPLQHRYDAYNYWIYFSISTAGCSRTQGGEVFTRGTWFLPHADPT